MPPFAHPEPLIPDHPAHQRLRSDSVDLACSAGSPFFLGRLWPSRRRISSPFKSASVGGAQEICELSKPSTSFGQCTSSNPPNCVKFDDLHCNAEPPREDSEDGQLKYASDFQELQCKFVIDGFHCKEAFPEGSIVECREDSCRNLSIEATVESRGEGSEGGSAELQEVGMKPLMESSKEVMVNKESINNGTEARNVSGLEKQGEQKEGVDQMLMKRLPSFKKAGDANCISGAKKMWMLTLCELQRVVASLQWGNSLQERWLAADEVRRLCTEDPIARITLGIQLGAIPPLVSLLHSPHRKHQCTALLALLNLAVGNDVNKGAIVKAKAVPRMVELLQGTHVEVQTAAVSLFLSLSALDANKEEIGASGSVELLVTLMHSDHTRKDALRTLYNLSIFVDNVRFIIEAGGIPILLAMVPDMDMADKSLATLSNLVQTDVGRHAFSHHKTASYAVLIDAMQCMERPKCQERAVYVLMMIAHHSRSQRDEMVAAGIIPALLELSLLGTPLAQRRAMRTLDSFRRAKAFSAPQQRESQPMEGDGEDSQDRIPQTMSEKKVVDGLVRKSLHSTMQRITRRANLSIVLGDSGYAEPSSAVWSFRQRRRQRRSSSLSLSY